MQTILLIVVAFSIPVTVGAAIWAYSLHKDNNQPEGRRGHA